MLFRSATPEIIASSMAVAREHADAATRALTEAGRLDPAVCERLGTLVDGMVRRTN